MRWNVNVAPSRKVMHIQSTVQGPGSLREDRIVAADLPQPVLKGVTGNSVVAARHANTESASVMPVLTEPPSKTQSSDSQPHRRFQQIAERTSRKTPSLHPNLI
jgi:hypothetical protein